MQEQDNVPTQPLSLNEFRDVVESGFCFCFCFVFYFIYVFIQQVLVSYAFYTY